VTINKINIIHRSGLVRYKKVSIIISLGMNPSRGGIPPKLRIGMVKFEVTIWLFEWRFLVLILLSIKITVIITTE